MTMDFELWWKYSQDITDLREFLYRLGLENTGVYRFCTMRKSQPISLRNAHKIRLFGLHILESDSIRSLADTRVSTGDRTDEVSLSGSDVRFCVFLNKFMSCSFQ